MPLLAPLPPENYGALLATILGMVGKDGCKACHDNFRQKK